MIRIAPRLIIGSLLLLASAPATPGTATPQTHQLTFEDRVRAQEAIERVYDSDQIGATLPFEEAVPREVLENKVRTYLRQIAAMEKVSRTLVTGKMLREEAARVARNSRMPARLEELYAALGNDPVLIQECLLRPVLVDRLEPLEQTAAFPHARQRSVLASLRVSFPHLILG